MQPRLISGMKIRSLAWARSFFVVSMLVFTSSGEVQGCIKSFTKAIEGVWFGASLMLFSMSIQILQ